jgi:hypothetical protein
MMLRETVLLVALFAGFLSGQNLALDVSGVKPGAITVDSTPATVTVHWKDEIARPWDAVFSLDPRQPLIAAVSIEGRRVIERAQPFYRCETGKRRGGWDAFFDFPPAAPAGTRAFLAEFHPRNARVRSIGDRVEVSFDGMRMGIFEGSLRYIFYPGSRLIEQQAALATQEPDVAYFYDTGLRMTSRADDAPGGNMDSRVSYFDTDGKFQTITPAYGSERRPLAVRYRVLGARMGTGSIAVFPAPHQYLFARDYTTNMGYVWYTAWRGAVSLGIRQLPDDHSPYYPWMNAPPGTEQQMRMFLLVGDTDARRTLETVLRYTHGDRFPKLPGYITFAPHWHVAYTMQAREHGFDWQPPFKPVMKAIGVDSADKGQIRLDELQDFFRACRAQSDKDFLLIPAEEANVFLGGHWAVAFPKPVYWHMNRAPDQPFVASDPKYGTVYNAGNAKEMWEIVQREHGYAYQTHPRTKGSTGYPDAIRDTDYFKDPRYFGSGWKAMPSDLSSPRLGERAFKTMDDMNNLGLRKRMMGEVDVFQLDTTHELYGHMNVNYVRLNGLPSYDNYGQVLDAVARGDSFMTTGEILIPDAEVKGAGEVVTASVTADFTFPLRMAEIVWGDGAATHHHMIPLDDTREFGKRQFRWQADAPGWKWARLAIWDVAGNGAFTNPIWR